MNFIEMISAISELDVDLGPEASILFLLICLHKKLNHAIKPYKLIRKVLSDSANPQLVFTFTTKFRT